MPCCFRDFIQPELPRNDSPRLGRWLHTHSNRPYKISHKQRGITYFPIFPRNSTYPFPMAACAFAFAWTRKRMKEALSLLSLDFVTRSETRSLVLGPHSLAQLLHSHLQRQLLTMDPRKCMLPVHSPHTIKRTHSAQTKRRLAQEALAPMGLAPRPMKVIRPESPRMRVDK